MTPPATSEKLTGLNSLAYQHPEDRSMLKKLKAVPLMDKLVSNLVDHQKLSMEINLVANAVHVTPTVMPRVEEAFNRACRALDFREPYPLLYVSPGLEINAYTTGADQPYVCLNAGAVERLSTDELVFVIGHELGHVQCQHVKYTTLAQILANVGGFFGSKIPVLGELVNLGFQATVIPLLFRWMRRAELTADRAGLLACQDRQIAQSALIKLAGFPVTESSSIKPEVFLQQYEEYHRRVGQSAYTRASDLLSVAQRSHPFTVERVATMQYWVDEGSFAEILEATPAERRQIAERNNVQPELAELHAVISNSLISWAMQEFNVTRADVARPARKLVNLQQSPRGTALEPVLRVEWVAEQINATTLEYFLLILFNRGGKPVRTKVALPFPEEFDEAPDEVKDEFIRHGKKQLVRLLYTAKETKP